MALDPTALEDALADIFASMPDTPADCAEALANAYLDYAQQATFGPNIPASLAAKIPTLKSTLEGAIDTPLVGLPATLAAAWATGLAAFWTGVAVASVPPATVGTTGGCPGSSSLTGSLSTVFANLANTAATCAAGVAVALHTATMTVQATVTPPPGTVVPIS